MIDLQPLASGVSLPVKAQPGARANAIRGEQNGALKVAVTQVAEKGKANKAIIEVLCRALELRKSQIELLVGETSSEKRFLVTGVALDELATRIAAVVEAAAKR
jgi:uncharacterized protein YggU (UPF0235/DUF167 family)